jgi:hypothetical protein
MKLERVVLSTAAFDHRDDPDPAKQARGQHPAELFFALKGPHGAIALSVLTGWTIEALDLGRWQDAGRPAFWPFASSLSIHRRLGVGAPSTACCEFLAGPCWGSQTAIGADLFWRTLVAEGLEPFWQALEKRYREEFD